MDQRTYRSRVGLSIEPRPARETLDLIKRAETGGVENVWAIMNALGQDLPTIYAAAAVQTERIALGTAIVPAFTRYPFALAAQALVIEDFAPGRLRLGIGPSYESLMVDAYGLTFDKPLARLREYLQILRTGLHQGEVEFHGEYYQVKGKLTASAPMPVLVSALRERAFELAGELSDGAISAICPPDYLLNVAKPAMERGAQAAGRPTPPLIVHIIVALEGPGRDAEAIRAEARKAMVDYAGGPYMRKMLAASGYPVDADGHPPEALIDQLVITGDETAAQDGIKRLLDRGLDELMLMVLPSPDRDAEERRLISLIGGL
jgi:alkanesulfonate monooxygenase SsuD/methylene tetrahydromethanopterin reductase-like flavin-dependent oxidoreductase (luciferase family)